MEKYRLIPAEDDLIWDSIVEESPQGTIFSSSIFLSSVGKKTLRQFVLKGNDIRAAVSLVLSENGEKIELEDLIIYNGIMFRSDNSHKESKARHERFEITEFIINTLDENFDQIQMTLSPNFEDIRPFLWHNYHSKRIDDKFCTTIKYTSFLDISELANDEDEESTKIFRELETLRQRNIREARKANIEVSIGTNLGLFIDFYSNLMQSQGEIVSREKLTTIFNLCENLIDNKKAVLIESRNRNHKINYILIFCYDLKRAYYLFGAGDLELNERYKGTIAFWDAFKILSNQLDIKEIDLEGVNSPNRGWFKLSFGGNLKQYFQVGKN